ncbi:MAG: hypothetical protein AAFA34_01580 [Thermoplasmata archaeon]|jgi:hypothetical protein
MLATDRSIRTPIPWRTHGRTLAATLLGTVLLVPGMGTGPTPATPAPPGGPHPLPSPPGIDRPAVDSAGGAQGLGAKNGSAVPRNPPGSAPSDPAPMDAPVAYGLCGAFTAGLLALALLPRRSSSPGAGGAPRAPEPAAGGAGR